MCIVNDRYIDAYIQGFPCDAKEKGAIFSVHGYIIGPVLTGFRIPASPSSFTKFASIRSQLRATTKLIVTGIYSVFRDIVELYGISPTGTTKSGVSAIEAMRPSSKPRGGEVGALFSDVSHFGGFWDYR